MTSQPGKKTMAIHIMPNVPNSKVNAIWTVNFQRNPVRKTIAA